jgi:hypothetical protein
VDDLTKRRALYDEDGDGFVSPAEAEGYHRRYVGQLDHNHDGGLSWAELKPITPGVPDLEVAYEELVGASSVASPRGNAGIGAPACVTKCWPSAMPRERPTSCTGRSPLARRFRAYAIIRRRCEANFIPRV